MEIFKKAFLAWIDPSKENKAKLSGAAGEAQSALAFTLFLGSEYRAIHNITLKTDWGTSQIDHVIVSPYGIFVVETKNIQGSVYGSEHQSHWTVCLGNQKNRILNPIIQNKGHIAALVSKTKFPEKFFHNVVFFWHENCRFKTEMPDYVRNDGMCAYIQSKKEVIIRGDYVASVVQFLSAHSLPKNSQTEKLHLENIRKKYG